VSEWTSDELERIAAAEELQLASVCPRRDAREAGDEIWVVRHGDDLYVRSWRGRTSTWFWGAQDRHEGHIRAGGVGKDLVDDDVNDAIDTAYRTKYRRYSDSYVPPMITPQARGTTTQLVPRPDRLLSFSSENHYETG